MGNEENSWGAERALVMSKISEFSENQKELFDVHHKLSESVTVIKVKLGFMVAGISTVVSVIVGVLMTIAQTVLSAG